MGVDTQYLDCDSQPIEPILFWVCFRFEPGLWYMAGLDRSIESVPAHG